jgi:hypothetical protein
VRPARKFSTDEDVLARQHGSRKAPVRMEIQRQKQILTAGAGNAIDIAVACQVERADAFVGVEPHQRSAKARQAIDLLIRAQFHIVEASIARVVTLFLLSLIFAPVFPAANQLLALSNDGDIL